MVVYEELPRYRIVDFYSTYDSDYKDRADLDQTLKLKGNTMKIE